MSSAASSSNNIDAEYPGTAVARMHAIRDRVKQLDSSSDLSGDWEDVRRKILRVRELNGCLFRYYINLSFFLSVSLSRYLSYL